MEARQRTRIQLLLVSVVVSGERSRQHADSPALAEMVERSLALLDGIRGEVTGDPELEALYRRVRGELETRAPGPDA
jgi:hypothetical protein